MNMRRGVVFSCSWSLFKLLKHLTSFSSHRCAKHCKIWSLPSAPHRWVLHCDITSFPDKHPWICPCISYLTGKKNKTKKNGVTQLDLQLRYFIFTSHLLLQHCHVFSSFLLALISPLRPHHVLHQTCSPASAFLTFLHAAHPYSLCFWYRKNKTCVA